MKIQLVYECAFSSPVFTFPKRLLHETRRAAGLDWILVLYEVTCFDVTQVHFRPAQRTAVYQTWTLAAAATRQMTTPKVVSNPLQVTHLFDI